MLSTVADVASLDFDHATLITNNLGGLDSATESPVIRMGHVGTTSDGTSIDLQISNVTAYRAFNTGINGISHKPNGSFGVINLLAPQASEASTVSFVQLRYSFVDGATGLPLTLSRTHVTFYDFDDSSSGVSECVQVSGGVADLSARGSAGR